MQILRHLESQLKYIVIETEHLFPSGLHGTKATVQGLQSSIGEMSLTLSCHCSLNLKGISDRKCCDAGLASSFFSFSPFSLSSSLPLFFCWVFSPNFLTLGLCSFPLSCLSPLEGKVLQLCSDHNFGHLPVGWVSYLTPEKGPS